MAYSPKVQRENIKMWEKRRDDWYANAADAPIRKDILIACCVGAQAPAQACQRYQSPWKAILRQCDPIACAFIGHHC
jgi:hypothetical protein